jgi:hypothetical protein
MERPADRIKRPVDHIARRVDHIARPVDHIARPVDHIARPVDHIARLVDHIARPVEDIARSVDHIARLVDHIARPVEDLARPVDHIDREIDRIGRPVDHIDRAQDRRWVRRGIPVDADGAPDARRQIDNLGLGAVRVHADVTGALAREGRVTALPTSYLVDRKGHVLGRRVGAGGLWRLYFKVRESLGDRPHDASSGSRASAATRGVHRRSSRRPSRSSRAASGSRAPRTPAPLGRRTRSCFSS